MANGKSGRGLLAAFRVATAEPHRVTPVTELARDLSTNAQMKQLV